MEEITSAAEAVQFARNQIEYFVPLAPEIVTQPEDQVVVLGGTANFNVAVAGAQPLNYQWRKDNIDIPGAEGSAYSITGVQSNHYGNYSVVVTNRFGVVTSRLAKLDWGLKPEIIQAPLSQSIVEGGNITFSVEIVGHPAPFTYQWRRSSTILTNIESDERHAFFTLNDVESNQGGLYRLVIINAVVPVVTGSSPNATWTLTVLPDTDGDGLPDEWEAEHLVDDPNGDPDRDGMTNREEYEAGTDPNEPDSTLRIEPLDPLGSAAIEFQAISNKTYTVQYLDEVGRGSWSRLADVVARTTNRVEVIYDPRNAARRYYRVVTPRQE